MNLHPPPWKRNRQNEFTPSANGDTTSVSVAFRANMTASRVDSSSMFGKAVLGVVQLIFQNCFTPLHETIAELNLK